MTPDKIPTKEYMQDGWNDCGFVVHPYKRGSRHNKIGMWIMWIFYIIVSIQLIIAFATIPFFPITFITLIILSLMSYVVVVAKMNNS
tara:strand:- start:256 stop:516 length:261 start_codon:yes stop_codon:yes gene_type:complete